MKLYRLKFSRLFFIIFFLAAVSLYLLNRHTVHHSSTITRTKEQRKLLWEQADEKRFRELRLKRGANDVPVVIVDQHQEVIPYWFKAVHEGIISRRGNTLIHIDGHSDMAPPDNYKTFKRFKFLQNMSVKNYLPLMQSNDVFIISAIMTGLIEKVIFVQPDWNDGANITSILTGYVGDHRNSTQLCLCFRARRRSKFPPMEFRCSVLNRNDETGENGKESPATDCPVIKTFKYYVISESKFKRILNFKNRKNIIVDIDEDYFGVESGVQDFINQGVELKTQEMLDHLLSRMVCPESINDEILLNRQFQEFFLSVYNLKRKSVDYDDVEMKEKLKDDYDDTDLEKRFRIKLFQYTGQFICNRKYVPEFILFLTMVNGKELKALSKAKFCMFNSPRLRGNSQETNSGFSVCHGTIFPEDTLNKIHVGSNAEIDNRASNLKSMLEHISSFITPKMYTICRSLRDGYTPRRQQRYIEKQLTQAVAEVNEANGQNQNLVYDSQLVFGKDGWLNDDQ